MRGQPRDPLFAPCGASQASAFADSAMLSRPRLQFRQLGTISRLPILRIESEMILRFDSRCASIEMCCSWHPPQRSPS